MPQLTTSEIADMRSEQNETMPDTVVIWRYTSLSDGMGGVSETWASAGTVIGRLAPMPRLAGERIIGEQLLAADAWVITVPNGTMVYERDRLGVGARTFEVEYTNAHEAWETALRLYCNEVGG